MSYLKWTLLALASYTMVAPLMKLATSEIPSEVATAISNTILVGAALIVILVSHERFGDYLTNSKAVYAVAAGVFLAVGILSYYKALSLGPISVVVPIYGLFIVTSSVIGFVFFDEVVTSRKLLGIGFAVLALYFTAGSGG